MARKGRAQLRALLQLVEKAYPRIDAESAIRAGGVVVDGRVARNPASLIPVGASVVLRSRDGDPPLRGEAKLDAAFAAFDVSVAGRTALDLGASAGGFTRVLLRRGAVRVYAVDAGFGQLLGSLRQDERVVNLERTNLATLTTRIVPERIDVVTADLSYLSLAAALPQLNDRVRFAIDAELIALVKPQFELGLRTAPTESRLLDQAVEHAAAGAIEAGWKVGSAIQSPVCGTRGAVEFLLHGRR